MIGDGQRIEAVPVGEFEQFAGRAGSVGIVGMGVEIDHGANGSEGNSNVSPAALTISLPEPRGFP